MSNKPGSSIIDFYADSLPNVDGKTLAQILDAYDDVMELDHAYIQWLFPVKRPSQFNYSAPILSDDDIKYLRCDAVCQERFEAAVTRFLAFLGCALVVRDGKRVVEKGKSWKDRSHNWLQRNNHNHLRITRVLESMRFFGRQDLALAFYGFLTEIQSEHNGQQVISEETQTYWREAACKDA